MSHRLCGRAFALILAFVMLMLSLPVVLPTASAVNYSVSEKYMLQSVRSTGCNISPGGSDFIGVEIKEADSSIWGDTPENLSVSGLNAIRIVLQNSSSCNNLIFEYRHTDENGTEQTKTTEVEIEPNSAKHEYYALVDLSHGIDYYKITFDGVKSGRMRIYAIGAISMYDNGVGEELGRISECRYDTATSTVSVKGTVKYDATVAYKDQKLGIFKLSNNIELEDICENADILPVSTVSLSNRFSFDLPIETFSDRMARYAVVIITEDQNGDEYRIPLSYARYAEGRAPTLPEKTSYNEDLKGINTYYHASAIDGGAATAVVDVYLNKLIDTTSAGLYHSLFGSNFYFDRAYLEQIDLAVKNYSGAGAKVYLRFLVSPGLDALPYATPAFFLDVKFRGLVATDETAKSYIYAFADFLSARYAASDRGDVSGIIVGSRVDLSAHYNYTENILLGSYVKNYAEVLSLVSVAWRSHDPDVEIVMPLSDEINDDVISSNENYMNYTKSVFLANVCDYISGALSEGNNIRVMLETDTTPLILGEDSKLHFDSEVSASGISACNIEKFNSLLTSLNDYDCLDEKFLFYWNVSEYISGRELSASYVYSYLKLLNEKNVSEFIVAFSQLEEDGDDRFYQIKNLFKYINTQRSSEVTDFAKEELGISDWKEVISLYGRSDILQNNTYFTELLEDDGYTDSFAGSYDYWSFASATGTLNWYAGINCTALDVVSYDNGRALTGSMKQTRTEEYASMVYNFPYTEDLGVGDALSFKLQISSDIKSFYELKIVISGDGYTYEANKLVSSGESTVFVLDTNTLRALENAESIRISTRDINNSQSSYTVRLFEASAHSIEDDSQTLYQKIHDSRAELKGYGDKDARPKLSSEYIVYIFLAVLVMIILTVLVIRKNTAKEE